MSGIVRDTGVARKTSKSFRRYHRTQSGPSAAGSRSSSPGDHFNFHLAAIYDLAVDCRSFARERRGTLNVNQFAKSVAKLRRYNYVSTCYVAGKREGLILENELHHHEGFGIIMKRPSTWQSWKLRP